MNSRATILIYGRDLSLLQTRGWVLERAGYVVCLTQTLVEASQIATEHPLSLLLLCHSLSPEDSAEALAAVAGIRPKIKALLVTANTVVAASARGESTVSAFGGPRAMIAAVGRVLASEAGH